jgi:tRNA(fMet)-specific endonuclease VapC
VLDTDHCIELLRGQPKVVAKLKAMGEDIEIYTTIITAAELFYGACRSLKIEQNLQEVRALLEDVQVLGLDLYSAEKYGLLKAELSQKGELIADNDLLIASVVLSHDLILITHNTQHYARIPHLRLEDWLK